MKDNIRPWGRYDILLDEEYCKVKKITVKPKQCPSYQYHYKRAEIWSIVKGYGVVTIDGIKSMVKCGDIVEIPTEVKHRIENTDANEDLVFIEVQHGTYFGEDDIVRLEDKYGRQDET